MNISLINPLKWPAYNIGLTYVATSINNSKHKVRIIDTATCGRKADKFVVSNIKEQKPHIVGFSVMTSTLERSLMLSRKIKEISPDLPIIFGGIHPTLLPEETLSSPYVDAVCIGEGEKAIIELLDSLEEKKEPDVKGIWYKKEGRIIKNELRIWEENLDSLTFPDWSFWDLDIYFKNYTIPNCLPVLGVRGCPYSCTFCSNEVLNKLINRKYFRIRSAENVIKEIENNIDKYNNHGLRTFIFEDDIFGINKEYYKKITGYFINSGLNNNYPWACKTTVNMITEGWAKRLKRAGCRFISFGLESGNENIRIKNYNKLIKNNEFRQAARILKDLRIHYNINVIVGSPSDSKESIRCSVNFSESLNPLFICYCQYVPLPKTRLGEKCVDLKLIRSARSEYDLPKVDTQHLHYSEVDRFMIYLKVRESIRMIRWVIKNIGILFFIKFSLTILLYTLNISKKGSFILRFNMKNILPKRIILEYLFFENKHNLCVK